VNTFTGFAYTFTKLHDRRTSSRHAVRTRMGAVSRTVSIVCGLRKKRQQRTKPATNERNRRQVTLAASSSARSSLCTTGEWWVTFGQAVERTQATRGRAARERRVLSLSQELLSSVLVEKLAKKSVLETTDFVLCGTYGTLTHRSNQFSQELTVVGQRSRTTTRRRQKLSRKSHKGRVTLPC